MKLKAAHKSKDANVELIKRTRPSRAPRRQVVGECASDDEFEGVVALQRPLVLEAVRAQHARAEALSVETAFY